MSLKLTVLLQSAMYTAAVKTYIWHLVANSFTIVAPDWQFVVKQHCSYEINDRNFLTVMTVIICSMNSYKRSCSRYVSQQVFLNKQLCFCTMSINVHKECMPLVVQKTERYVTVINVISSW